MLFDSHTSVPPPALSAFAPTRLEPGMRGAETRAPDTQAQASQDEDGFGFLDLLDAVNPLQHIPIVSSIYREVTGDEIGNPARIAGGFLFGGVIGLVSSIANAVIDETTGKDIGDHLMALVGDADDGTANRTADDLRFARARNAYEQLGSQPSDPMMDYTVEAP